MYFLRKKARQLADNVIKSALDDDVCERCTGPNKTAPYGECRTYTENLCDYDCFCLYDSQAHKKCKKPEDNTIFL